MSIPDPDEAMDSRVDEPIDDYFDSANANEMDEDFSRPILSPILPDDNAFPAEQCQIHRQNVVNTVSVDLEAIATSYQGYGLINRLLFIADTCPPLQKDALVMIINYVVEKTSNVQVYLEAHRRLDLLKSTIGAVHIDQQDSEQDPSVVADELPRMDTQWVDSTSGKAQARLDMLASEFKRQKDEGVKESTRRAIEEVFQQQILMGHLQDAGRLYGRGMREYCSSPKHIIQMLLDWVEVTIHLSQWHRVDPLVAQIERAIVEAVESENVAATLNSSINRFVVGITQAATKRAKEFIQVAKSKIAAVTALQKLNTKCYRQVAEKCLQVDLDFFDYPTILAPRDIAFYGVLCALACFDRSELKERVVNNELFQKFLESEPKLVELVRKFCGSQFGVCFDILEEIRDQLLLNMYIWSHVSDLYRMIRHRAIIQYFTPYVIADMEKMAVVFRTSTNDLENELVKLIQNCEISAKIDSFNKKLHAKRKDEVVAAYCELMDVGHSLREQAMNIILRATLHRSQIVVANNSESHRPKRRPTHGQQPFGGNDGSSSKLDNESDNSTNFSQGTGRGFMARFFGVPRASIGQSNNACENAPDSSNEARKNEKSDKTMPQIVNELDFSSFEASSSFSTGGTPQNTNTSELVDNELDSSLPMDNGVSEMDEHDNSTMDH